jgi:ribosomal-protein-alanine N-acetyltransferase
MEEAIKKVVYYAFQTIRLKKIDAFTHNGNRNSTNLLEKLHFIKSIEADKESTDFNIFTLTNSLENKLIQKLQ